MARPGLRPLTALAVGAMDVFQLLPVFHTKGNAVLCPLAPLAAHARIRCNQAKRADIMRSLLSPKIRPALRERISKFLSVCGQILGILNEIPATSRKYEFVLAMADRIITENLQDGHVALLDANRTVLSSAFSRTCELLRRSLQTSEAAASATWPSHVLRLLPLGPNLAACFDAARLCLDTLLPAATDAWRPSKPPRHLALTAPGAGSGEWLEAEKLAHELLWITGKMMACSATAEATVRWGFASGLASLSLTAHPRVQGPIVKISALLLRELARGEWELPREVRFRILAAWIPLFCYASNRVACPVLTGAERREVERVVEELISGLPWEDQEVVLGNWLEDFAASDSEWPNLQRCSDSWGAPPKN